MAVPQEVPSLDIDMDELEQLRFRFNETFGVLHVIASPEPRPCMSLPLLKSLQKMLALVNGSGSVIFKGKSWIVNYLVFQSDVDGVFNLGGDLELFSMAVDTNNRDLLLEYARLCIDVLWRYYEMQDSIITVSLIQGQAMGGGFEAALASNVIVAEKGAQMGFPEIMFDLFPGMGALSFLSRKADLPTATAFVRTGRICTAEELFDSCIVDVLAEEGQGPEALYRWVESKHRKLRAYKAINRARRKIDPLSAEELYDIVEIWVDTAMELDERSLAMMRRLVRAQNSKAAGSADRPASASGA